MDDEGTAAMPLAKVVLMRSLLGAAALSEEDGALVAAAPLSTVADTAPLVMDANTDERSPDTVAVSAYEDAGADCAYEDAGAVSALLNAEAYIEEM